MVVATAVQKSVPLQIRAVGNVEPYATVSIKSQVTGVLQKAHFKEGQDVKNGQLLFTIDARPLEAALMRTEPPSTTPKYILATVTFIHPLRVESAAC